MSDSLLGNPLLPNKNQGCTLCSPDFCVYMSFFNTGLVLLQNMKNEPLIDYNNDDADFTAQEFLFFLLKNLSNRYIATAKIIA